MTARGWKLTIRAPALERSLLTSIGEATADRMQAWLSAGISGGSVEPAKTKEKVSHYT